MLRSRPFHLTVLAVVAVLLVGSCTKNLATGEQSFTGFMSAEDERRIGAEEHPKIIKQFGGAYDDPKVSGYVAELGFRLLKVSETPNESFHFTVLDSDVVNAFALPGGYVYISRGLIALAENEAELAGVIGHEIGHVVARHSAQRYSQAMAANIGLTIVGIIGAVAGVPGDVNNLLSAGANAVLKGYSREQELEADKLGVRYLSRAGYDPDSMRSFFEKMAGNDELRSKMTGQPTGEESYDFGSTHPRTSDRIQQAIDLAAGTTVANPVINRDRFLVQVDGMIFGDSPEQGVRRGREFAHPDLRVAFTVPPGFTLQNSPSEVVALHPDAGAIVFDMEPDPQVAKSADSLKRYLAETWSGQLGLRDLERIDINGMEAWTGRARLSTRNGVREVRRVAARRSAEDIFRFTFITPPEQLGNVGEGLRRTTYSLRTLSDAEVEAIKPLRIRAHTVASGETIDTLVQEMAVEEFADDWFRLINKNAIDAGIRSGEQVKVVNE